MRILVLLIISQAAVWSADLPTTEQTKSSKKSVLHKNERQLSFKKEMGEVNILFLTLTTKSNSTLLKEEAANLLSAFLEKYHPTTEKKSKDDILRMEKKELNSFISKAFKALQATIDTKTT